MPRRLTLLVVLAALVLGLLAPPSALAGAKEQLPSAKQLGPKWKVGQTKQYATSEIQGVSTGGLVNAFYRTYRRKGAKVTVVLYYYGDPALASASFTEQQGRYTASHVEIPPFGQGSYGDKFGKSITGVFFQGGTFGTVNVRRKGPGLKKLVSRLGGRVAFKVAATP